VAASPKKGAFSEGFGYLEITAFRKEISSMAMELLSPVSCPTEAMSPSFSLIIPVYNSARTLRSCLEHLRSSAFTDYETIVVDDGSTDESAAVAREFGATVLETGRRSGPAYARNLGASKASGEVLFFIDADVCVYPNTLARVAANFQQDPELAAVIGSYDDLPESQDFLSLYRNLMHSYVHHQSRSDACTFWSGCGAIRKPIFQQYSGFDESYRRPAIEDIELGYRMTRDHRKMLLDTGVLVKHLKRWSFVNLVKTDIMDRGIPWTELILRDRFLPNDLNLQLSQRVSVALVFVLIGVAGAAAWYAGSAFLLLLLTVLFLMLAQFEVETTWKTQPKAMMGTTALILSIIGLAYYNHDSILIPPVLLAYGLLFLRHRYSFTTLRRRRITGIVCGLYLAFVISFVIVTLPHHPMVFLFYFVLSMVIMLNSQFYVFLAGRTGRLLALAAIPFHLLFHFYNGVSFLVGGIKHLLRGQLSPMEKATEEKELPVSPDQ
jgi:glycosyltransferase involved in cell wall biosynthesis